MARIKLGFLLALVALLITAGIAAVAGFRPIAQAAAGPRMAFTQGKSLWLANADGTGRQLLATGTTSSTYSWYQWSPDGKYLLVSQNIPNASASNLLLYDSNGVKLRTLVHHAPWAGFYPSWASNADEIAYVAGSCAATGVRCAHSADQAAFSIDMAGKKRFIGSYTTNGAGCGGGGMDPAGNLLTVETDFGVSMPRLSWAVGRPVSFLGVMGYVPQPLEKAPMPMNVTVSAFGVTAGTIQRCSGNNCASYVVLLDPASGRVLRTIGQGELPAWSPDGKLLYFVRRTAGKTLTFHDAMKNSISSQVYTSAIWRVDGDGSHPTRIISERAFGFGPLSVTSDGSALVFSRVGNDTRLWTHRLPGDRFDGALMKTYGPKVRIQRIDVATGAVTMMVSNAGRPAVGA